MSTTWEISIIATFPSIFADCQQYLVVWYISKDCESTYFCQLPILRENLILRFKIFCLLKYWEYQFSWGINFREFGLLTKLSTLTVYIQSQFYHNSITIHTKCRTIRHFRNKFHDLRYTLWEANRSQPISGWRRNTTLRWRGVPRSRCSVSNHSVTIGSLVSIDTEIKHTVWMVTSVSIR